jgi:hypothetical protein
MRLGSPKSCSRIISESCSTVLERISVHEVDEIHADVPARNVDLASEHEHGIVPDPTSPHCCFWIVQLTAFIGYALLRYGNTRLIVRRVSEITRRERMSGNAHLGLKQGHNILELHIRVDLDDKRVPQVGYERQLHCVDDEMVTNREQERKI